MKKFDFTILIILAFTLLVIGGILIAAFKTSSSSSPVPQYSSGDQTAPKIEISEKNFELGKMKVSEVKTKEMNIKNTGASALNLSNFSTSCGCTKVQLIVDSEKSPEFDLHNSPVWSKDLNPGQSAILKITYQPSLMPVEGEVSRTVYFKTNDPASVDVQIDFTAFVEK